MKLAVEDARRWAFEEEERQRAWLERSFDTHV
jgi:hypothetical protein